MNEVLLQNYIPSLATLIVLGIGILFNNARMSDLNARIGDLNTNINKRIDDLRADTFARFERLEGQQTRLEGQQVRLESQYARLESVLIGKLDEVDARLNRIESHLGLH
jgi:flagellin-like hook-associated protein FlgL